MAFEREWSHTSCVPSHLLWRCLGRYWKCRPVWKMLQSTRDASNWSCTAGRRCFSDNSTKRSRGESFFFHQVRKNIFHSLFKGRNEGVLASTFVEWKWNMFYLIESFCCALQKLNIIQQFNMGLSRIGQAFCNFKQLLCWCWMRMNHGQNSASQEWVFDHTWEIGK